MRTSRDSIGSSSGALRKSRESHLRKSRDNRDAMNAMNMNISNQQNQQHQHNNYKCDMMRHLVVARRQYLSHADENWQSFLDKVQGAYEFFFGSRPDRTYRDSFTIENYRMLFQRET